MFKQEKNSPVLYAILLLIMLVVISYILKGIFYYSTEFLKIGYIYDNYNDICIIISELLVIIYSFKNRKSIKLFYVNKKMFLLLLPIAIIMFGARIITSELINLQAIFMPAQNNVGGTEISMYEIVGLIIIAPIFQEIIFRGIILQRFLKKYSISFSILVSSVLFTLIHTDIYSIIPNFIMGIIFAIIAIETQSLVTCIFAHFVQNSIPIGFSIILSTNFGSRFASQFDGNFQPIWFDCIGILSVILGVIIFLTIHKYYTGTEKPSFDN